MVLLPSRRASARAFTMIEMITVLVISSVLLAAGYFGYQAMIGSNDKAAARAAATQFAQNATTAASHSDLDVADLDDATMAQVIADAEDVGAEVTLGRPAADGRLSAGVVVGKWCTEVVFKTDLERPALNTTAAKSFCHTNLS